MGRYIEYDGVVVESSQAPLKVAEPINSNEDIRSYNVGDSDYASRRIQPWDIWEEYKLNPWEADIIKRVLRKKKTHGKTERESRVEDLEKIIHVAKELIRQLKQ